MAGGSDIPGWAEQVRFNEDGLVPAIAVDAEKGDVLMMAWMNRETLVRTIRTGTMTYWSRSRREVWVKGLTSGNVQRVVEARIDCDGDALLFKVRQEGAAVACHTGRRSCFYRALKDGEWSESAPDV